MFGYCERLVKADVWFLLEILATINGNTRFHCNSGLSIPNQTFGASLDFRGRPPRHRYNRCRSIQPTHWQGGPPCPSKQQ